MDIDRFRALASGHVQPDSGDYAAFVSLAEGMPYELLWKLLNASPNMNGLLRAVVNKNLQEKIPRINVDLALDAIATELLQLQRDADMEASRARVASNLISLKRTQF